jgi:hypothetical protein
MDLAGKLQLKPGQSVAIVAQPEGVSLEFGGDHPLAGAADQADGVIVFCRARDDLADLVKTRGVQPVRQVALDDTWSALRLRPA